MATTFTFYSAIRRFVLVGVVLSIGSGLGACASNQQNTHFLISTDAPRCAAFECMQYKKLPAEKKVRLAIDAADSAHQFQGGFSHYEALALPEMNTPYLLQIESEVVRNKRNDHGTIFFPVVTFLDADKQVIRQIDDLPFTFQAPFYARNHIRASVSISGELAAARYVLMHTTDARMNQAIATGDGKSILQSGGFNTMLFAPISSPRYRINFGREGWLRVLAYAQNKPST